VFGYALNKKARREGGLTFPVRGNLRGAGSSGGRALLLEPVKGGEQFGSARDDGPAYSADRNTLLRDPVFSGSLFDVQEASDLAHSLKDV
jgi:hypothetical protein